MAVRSHQSVRHPPSTELPTAGRNHKSAIRIYALQENDGNGSTTSGIDGGTKCSPRLRRSQHAFATASINLRVCPKTGQLIDLDARELEWLIADLALRMQRRGEVTAQRWWVEQCWTVQQ